ncbi:MAG: pyruvate:ferredoxin (flavodoxin) oxidoreductase [Candidatus Neomarinimicrobiota bacterium]|nr:MAG: pyruvate:ferredoxin (flavodoxin) oxidoreductase [Candidatus Neomarinimicrobiota bacterium]
MAQKMKSMDGNSAATHVAYAFSEVAAIYPITPSSGMGEMADAWAAKGLKNIFGQKVDVVELQSEAGASGAVHGALSGGAMTTTFTASQGLMLMLPNMHKIAGEMLPTVFHVSARSLACQSLSIFGDHSDVMSARNTGWALMALSSIQEIMDLGVVSHLATLKSSIPFLNFFDGFRNSHEIQKIYPIEYDVMKEMLDMKYVEAFRARAMNPENPLLKVGQEGPDTYFQGRETVNQYYLNAPAIVQEYMDALAKKVGRQYHLFDYFGAPDADKVIVIMGSGADTVEETIDYLNKRGEKVGLVKVRLYRPFSVEHFVKAFPESVKKIAVLDRTKEPGSIGEPLYLDVVASLAGKDIKVIGGRYGLSSKEFTPPMVKAVYDHLDGACTHGFTVGINDDVTHTSLEIKENINTIPEGTISCKFWGLGSDGTVGANKNSIKIIGDNTDMYAQGYFQYDSKKSGGTTRSHLRFGKHPIKSEYLVVDNVDFIACHNQAFIDRYDILEGIKENGVFLMNSVWSKEEAFENLPLAMQKTIIEKKIRFYNINALEIAKNVGLGGRINTVMMAAFFIISGVLEKDHAIKLIKDAIEKSYGAKGREIVEMNWKAVDATAEALVEVEVPSELPARHAPVKQLVPEDADEFVKNVIEKTMREKGDEIPVSQMPLDGYVPTGTAKLEKRGVAPFVPHWIKENCTQCNQCSFVCPHAAIRPKLIDPKDLKDAPEGFETLDAIGKDKGMKYRLQVYVEDCTGCMNCIEECPKGALVSKPIQEERDAGESERAIYFDNLPSDVLSKAVKLESVKGSQFKQPLLEFSGACAGCGETPYVKLITQLYGDRMIIANATGCSSIWGGTFPTIPYAKNKDGHGPTWANSLFEDNAEYGYGMRLAVDANRKQLRFNMERALELDVDEKLKTLIEEAFELWDTKGDEIKTVSKKIQALLPDMVKGASGERRTVLAKIQELESYIVPKSVWAIGGDGWAYDIGYGGLDHVMASNRNVNILVLDTEVYSNTGGQASKATPLGSVARFAEAGKTTKKKDLGMMLMSYGYVYVASVAMGANKNQFIKAVKEAEDYDGPAIIIAYAPCINHGCNMELTQQEEKKAVDTGYWLLYRYNPALKAEGKNPFTLDSRKPLLPVEEFLKGEKRYTSLKISFPENAEKYWKEQQIIVDERYEQYLKLAGK